MPKKATASPQAQAEKVTHAQLVQRVKSLESLVEQSNLIHKEEQLKLHRINEMQNKSIAAIVKAVKVLCDGTALDEALTLEIHMSTGTPMDLLQQEVASLKSAVENLAQQLTAETEARRIQESKLVDRINQFDGKNDAMGNTRAMASGLWEARLAPLNNRMTYLEQQFIGMQKHLDSIRFPFHQPMQQHFSTRPAGTNGPFYPVNPVVFGNPEAGRKTRKMRGHPMFDPNWGHVKYENNSQVMRDALQRHNTQWPPRGYMISPAAMETITFGQVLQYYDAGGMDAIKDAYYTFQIELLKRRSQSLRTNLPRCMSATEPLFDRLTKQLDEIEKLGPVVSSNLTQPGLRQLEDMIEAVSMEIGTYCLEETKKREGAAEQKEFDPQSFSEMIERTHGAIVDYPTVNVKEDLLRVAFLYKICKKHDVVNDHMFSPCIGPLIEHAQRLYSHAKYELDVSGSVVFPNNGEDHALWLQMRSLTNTVESMLLNRFGPHILIHWNVMPVDKDKFDVKVFAEQVQAQIKPDVAYPFNSVRDELLRFCHFYAVAENSGLLPVAVSAAGGNLAREAATELFNRVLSIFTQAGDGVPMFDEGASTVWSRLINYNSAMERALELRMGPDAFKREYATQVKPAPESAGPVMQFDAKAHYMELMAQSDLWNLDELDEACLSDALYFYAVAKDKQFFGDQTIRDTSDSIVKIVPQIFTQLRMRGRLYLSGPAERALIDALGEANMLMYRDLSRRMDLRAIPHASDIFK